MRCSGAIAMMLHLLVVLAVFKYVSSQDVTPPSGLCDGVMCGINAICEQDNGQSVCVCPLGTVGDPLRMCVSCQVDTDCADNQACRNNMCVDPCLNHFCLILLRQCVVKNHQPICEWRPI